MVDVHSTRVLYPTSGVKGNHDPIVVSANCQIIPTATVWHYVVSTFTLILTQN